MLVLHAANAKRLKVAGIVADVYTEAHVRLPRGDKCIMPSKKSSRVNPKPKARPGAAVHKTTDSAEATTAKPKTVPASIPPKERKPTQQQLERMARARRKQLERNLWTAFVVVIIVGLIGGFIYFVALPQGTTTANSPKATATSLAPDVPPTVTGTPTTTADGLQIIDIYVPPDPTANPTGTVTAGPTSTAGATATAGPSATPTAKPTPLPVAKSGDTVDVNYTGWLQSSFVKFDSSYDHAPPAPFEFTIGAGQVIKGWDEGVVGMKVGGKRRLIIPAALAYGDQGAGSTIPPGATLIFDIELVSVKSGS